jgi:hypothetical protein
MEAKDLRIGNFLYYKNTNDLGTVELIHKNHYECRDEFGIFTPNCSYEPIPLNAEWFEKFGYYDVNVPSHFIKDEMTIDEHRFWDCNGMFIDDKNGVRIEYVHQLQNLFFCLRGKELTIKNQE